jgi:mannose-6-phosphate isomerase
MTVSTAQLYPLSIEPLEKAAIWGGSALVERYGKHADPHAAIGESWECWDANRIVNGAFSGATLGDVRRELGRDLMGPIDPEQIFPVLTKIIDAREALSVQVHPDDAYAQRVEHQRNGKTECWYILAAQPGAELVLGWTRDTDRAEYERRVADGSLGEILRRVPVRSGETYYLPAGTLHAIGAGIELFETQQASDLTYRIFDWNRAGSDGKPRELHVAKAGDVLDFRASQRGAVEPLTFIEGGLERTLLVAEPRFVLERLRPQHGSATLVTGGVPLTLTALAHAVTVEAAAVQTPVAPYATIVVPAAVETVDVLCDGEMLVVHPALPLDALRAQLARCGVSASAVGVFLGQFA